MNDCQYKPKIVITGRNLRNESKYKNRAMEISVVV